MLNKALKATEIGGGPIKVRHAVEGIVGAVGYGKVVQPKMAERGTELGTGVIPHLIAAGVTIALTEGAIAAYDYFTGDKEEKKGDEKIDEKKVDEKKVDEKGEKKKAA